MSGISTIMNTARSALMTYQAALQTTGQNMSNVSNADYTIQLPNYSTCSPVETGGQIYGTGVTLSSVGQAVDQRLENHLTQSLCRKAALTERNLYLGQIEKLVTQGNKDSLGTLMTGFWNAWESLSNKTSDRTGQEKVVQAGTGLARRIRALDKGLLGIKESLNRNISESTGQINALSSKIAALNGAITSSESSGGRANDLRDRRNALVDKLGTLIDTQIIVKKDGSFHINTSEGIPLVSDRQSYSLSCREGKVLWQGTSGEQRDITDAISGGKLGGWLRVRDKAVSEIRSELNELAANLVWALNYQHSQGAGSKYFTGSVKGTYAAGASGVLDSLSYGSKINYTKDFAMIIKNGSSTTEARVDMSRSMSRIRDFSGSARPNSTYRLTVVDKGTIGKESVFETSGDKMGQIFTQASGTISDALDKALPEQTLTVKGQNGTTRIKILDQGGDAGRSAGQIAAKLSAVNGVSAYAASTHARFSLNGIKKAEDGDIISFSLYANGVEKKAAFTVDSAKGTLEEQFHSALKAAADQINKGFKNTDLKVDGTSISSRSGATIGIEKFEVVDNAGVALDQFSQFNGSDQVRFKLKGSSSKAIDVTVDLSGVDTSDSAKVAKAFYGALKSKLKDQPFSVEMDDATGKVVVRTTDGSGLGISSASGDTGNDARMRVTVLGSGTASGDTTLNFNGSDTIDVTPDTSTQDYLGISLKGCAGSGSAFAATTVGEAGGGHGSCAVVTGSVTVKTDPGLEVSSDNTTSAGLFGAGGEATAGNGIITLGGAGGYEHLGDGDKISFKVDGIDVSYTVSSGGGTLTDAEQARQLYDALTAALPKAGYQVVRNGLSVSVVRTAEADGRMAITEFRDAGGQDAALAVSTGTGRGTRPPGIKTLVADQGEKSAVKAATWGDPATLAWEEMDSRGRKTGRCGVVTIDGPGTVQIKKGPDFLLKFDIREGNLVAGNTMTVNTDAGGEPDVPKIQASGRGSARNETYKFSVASGGHIPNKGEPVVVNWSSGSGSGSFVLKGEKTPVTVEVDGMKLTFNGGTFVTKDAFFLSTDENGEVTPSGGSDSVRTLSDWHWTMESFAGQFNRKAGGVTARVARDNTLVFEKNTAYCPVKNVSCSGTHGIDKENMAITVLNHQALDTPVKGLGFVRTNGTWALRNDPTGGKMNILSQGGSDDGFKVDMDGDGVADMAVRFDTPVTGDGSVQMDMENVKSDDIGFVFAGSRDKDAGIAAAIGVNTFFTGTRAGDIGVNPTLENGDYIAARMVDSEDFTLAANGNTNALRLAKVKSLSLSMKRWACSRGTAPEETVSDDTLDGYTRAMVAGIGLRSQTAATALSYATTLTANLSRMRDSLSGVSLDEEIVRLTSQQQAYQAASKLLKAADEMFKTILSIR